MWSCRVQDMTFFDGSKQQPAPAAKAEPRPTWTKCLGVASAIGVLAFVLLAIGVFIGGVELTSFGFGGLCLAGLVACAGGYVYFFYERDE